MLSREDRKIYIFSTQMSASPRKIIDLARSSYSVTDCTSYKRGYLCLHLNSEEAEPQSYVMCMAKSEEMDEWMHAIVSAGVKSLEDEEDLIMLNKRQLPSSFFDYSARDIDLNQVSFQRYIGKLCLVVNIASK